MALTISQPFEINGDVLFQATTEDGTRYKFKVSREALEDACRHRDPPNLEFLEAFAMHLNAISDCAERLILAGVAVPGSENGPSLIDTALLNIYSK
jgi:hypothetical protein